MIGCPPEFLNRSDIRGLTLLELMIAVAILAILTAIAIMNLISYQQKARIANAVIEIQGMEKVLYNFETMNMQWPEDLSEAGLEDRKDPWGNNYRYAPVPGTPKGKLRKDRFMVPINSDFDLYSVGADGESRTPIVAKASHDDIIRANNGGYIGLASEY